MFMGRLGVDAIAAGGLAVTAFTAVLVAAGGLLAPVSPLVAEAHARGDSDVVERTEPFAVIRKGVVQPASDMTRDVERRAR